MAIGDWIQLADVIISLIGAIGTVIGLGFIYKQYKIANEQIKISAEQTKVMNEQIKSQEGLVQRERSIATAQKFCDYIENELGFLSTYYEKIDLQSILSSIKYADLKYFDIAEFDEVFGKETKNKYLGKIEKINIQKLSEAYLLYPCGDKCDTKSIAMFAKMNWKLPEKIKADITSLDDALKSGDEEKINKAKLYIKLKADMLNASNSLSHFYNNSITSLLNKLEYMAMEFRTGLADEEIVYQSLHQLYLSLVKSLYGSIALVNIKQTDKYYSNVIWLYGKWAERYSKKAQEEANLTRKLSHTSKYTMN